MKGVTQAKHEKSAQMIDGTPKQYQKDKLRVPTLTKHSLEQANLI